MDRGGRNGGVIHRFSDFSDLDVLRLNWVLTIPESRDIISSTDGREEYFFLRSVWYILLKVWRVGFGIPGAPSFSGNYLDVLRLNEADLGVDKKFLVC